MASGDGLDELLAPLRADPAGTAVLTDFDGTLAPIVADPADSRPLRGVVDVLDALAARYRTVAVVSGRPVAFLRLHLPATVELVGLYGLEWLRRGEAVDHPDAEAWRPVVARAAAAATAELPGGVLVEPKGVLLTLHTRQAEHLADVVERWATQRAALDGLVLHHGKKSVELHPPLAVDKGTTVRALAGGAGAVCFLGDDIGDLPAFAALAALRADGVATLSVAVRTAELPPEVLAAADVAVDGPIGALEVLRALAAEPDT